MSKVDVNFKMLLFFFSFDFIEYVFLVLLFPKDKFLFVAADSGH